VENSQDFSKIPIRELDPQQCAAELHESWNEFRRMIGVSDANMPNGYASAVERNDLISLFRQYSASYRQFNELTMADFETAMNAARVEFQNNKAAAIGAGKKPPFPSFEIPDFKKHLNTIAAVKASQENTRQLEAPKPTPDPPEVVLDKHLPLAWKNYNLFEAKGFLPQIQDAEKMPGCLDLLKSRMRAWPEWPTHAQIIADACHNGFSKRLEMALKSGRHEFTAPTGIRYTNRAQAEILASKIDQYNQGNQMKFNFDAVTEFIGCAMVAMLTQYCLVTFGRPENEPEPDQQRISIADKLRSKFSIPTINNLEDIKE